jgi:MFS family permease
MFLIAMPVDFSTELRLFSILVLILNVFGAVQDVAIDALACGVLEEQERGLANGLMFSGAYVGQAIGGAGVLFLTAWIDFNFTFIFVAAVILAVTCFVSLGLKEPPTPARPKTSESWLRSASGEVRDYCVAALKAFFGSRPAFVGLIFALLPAGAYSLSLTLQSNLAVELGLSDQNIAGLALVSTIISAVGCVVGGLLSDIFGRKRMLALYLAGTALPTLWLAAVMWNHGWIMPIDPKMPSRPIAPVSLILAFWLASVVFSIFHGLMYGTRTALFMDVCTPAVAATQFTAYMALLNLVISYSAFWQGRAIEAWGYPATLAMDAGVGMVCIAFLPLMGKGLTQELKAES